MIEGRRAQESRRAGSHVLGRLLAGAFLAVWVAACAPALRQGGSVREHKDMELLTRDDIVSGHFHNTYEAVQALRGNWLLSRPHSLLISNEPVLVYLDDVRLGDVSELQAIPIQPVIYIRHYDSLQATERWGIGHAQGVIYISTHPN